MTARLSQRAPKPPGFAPSPREPQRWEPVIPAPQQKEEANLSIFVFPDAGGLFFGWFVCFLAQINRLGAAVLLRALLPEDVKSQFLLFTPLSSAEP